MEEETPETNTRKYSKDLRFRETIVIGSGFNTSRLITTLPFNGVQLIGTDYDEFKPTMQEPLSFSITNPYKDIDLNSTENHFIEKVGDRKPITKKERLKRNKARKVAKRARRR